MCWACRAETELIYASGEYPKKYKEHEVRFSVHVPCNKCGEPRDISNMHCGYCEIDEHIAKE